MGVFRSSDRPSNNGSDNLPVIASAFGASPAKAAPYNSPRTLTAAATQIKINDKSEFEQFKIRRSSGSSMWQAEAWEYYDAIGEIKYAFNLVASVISRIRVFPAFVEDPSQAPVAVTQSPKIDHRLSSAAERGLDRLNSAFGGQPGLLRDAALNLSVAGEALALDTLIPTPNGLVRMGDLKDGDTVFGGDGTPATVVKALPIQRNRPVYEVVFDSGARIIADENHLWEVYPVAQRRWSATSGKQLMPQVLTTKQMTGAVHKYNTSNYAIKRAAVAQTHNDMLPLDPYILGYWLGDGWSSQGAITAHPDDQESLKRELAAVGYESKTRNAGDGYQVGVYRLKADLQATEVLNNKHVPEEYFHASVEARLALVQGLVDSDGHVYRNGQVEFSNKNLDIIHAFIRLTSSLGLKPGQAHKRLDGVYRVHVRAAGLPLARLPRKAEKLGTRTERDNWDYIRSITPIGERDVRCISVDSPGNTFLATENHIRTHNCYLVQIPERIGSGTPESWDIRSIDEIKTDPRGGYVVLGRREMGQGSSGGPANKLPSNAFIGRIWRSHPRYSDEADSSLRGLLDLCLAEGTLVYTPRGALPIENIAPGDLVYSRHPQTGDLISTIASRVWSTGTKPVFKIHARGRTLRATGNHPVLVLRDKNPHTKKGVSASYELEYIRVDELRRGDMLVSFESAAASAQSTDAQTLPSGVEINADVAWFIGQVTGDGHIQRSKYTTDCLNVSDFNPATRERLETIARKYWGATHFFHQNGTFRVKCKSLVADMRSLGLGVYSHQKSVPELIWASPVEIQKAFLAGYFDADGSGGSKSSGYKSYSSASEALVSQVRAMHVLHGDRVSSVMTTERPAVMHIAGNKRPTLNAKPIHRFEVYGSDSNRRGDLPMRRNRSAAAALPLDRPFVVSAVKSVTPDGEAVVWDMTVPETENFIADGLVVHNCAELLLLNRTFRATARSRLNAGALYLPDGLSVAASGDVDIYDDESDIDPAIVAAEAEDDFEEQLIDAMTTPIRDEESASAVVPLIIRGPAELGDKIKQFKFERSFDPALAQRADRVLERILQGLDVPKDVVTGLANVKYSNALQIDETLYKTHIEPLMLLIVDALTVVYLRPYLIASGFSPEEVNRIVVWYDPSAVSTRNDRAADADSGYDRYAVSLDTWRRAHGFSDADAPTANELAIRMMTERGAITPELTEAMLAALAPGVMDAVKSAQQASSVGALPPEVQQILNNAQTTAPETTEETPAATPETPEPQQESPDA